jgi:hypothetical protein
MTLDIDNNPLKQGDTVVCIESSIILAPYCKNPYKRPSIISKKKRKEIITEKNDNADDITIKIYNNSVREARLHRDEIVGYNTIKTLNPDKKRITMQWYKIKEVSGDHISFYPTSDENRTRHFHPARKFRKVIKTKK